MAPQAVASGARTLLVVAFPSPIWPDLSAPILAPENLLLAPSAARGPRRLSSEYGGGGSGVNLGAEDAHLACVGGQWPQWTHLPNPGAWGWKSGRFTEYCTAKAPGFWTPSTTLSRPLLTWIENIRGQGRCCEAKSKPTTCLHGPSTGQVCFVSQL